MTSLSILANEDGKFIYDISVEELTKLGLSVIEIDTDDGDYVRSRLEYVGASMSITLSDEFAKCTNAYTEKALPIQIKGRGNSTWNNGYNDGKPSTLPGDTHTRKVPYNIKLSEKADLFGMGERKSWVLLANHMDRSYLRCKLIYDLSANMGMYYTKSVYVNLMLNGEYMGVYMLCEKIDEELFEGEVTDWNDIAEDYAKGIAKDRGLDDEQTKALEEELKTNLQWITDGYVRFDGDKTKYRLSSYVDKSKLSTTTGFLFEYDGYADEESFFHTDLGVPIKVKNMEYIKTNEEIFSYVKQNFSDFEEALDSDTFYNSKGKHYSEYIDVDSFVDYYILNAIILNVEFGYKSMFMYMNEEGKLVLGPCWDYDWSSGNPFLGANGQYDHWYNDGRAGNNHWYHRLYSDPWFVSLVRERWYTVYRGIEDMIDSMDYYYEYLEPTVAIEYDKFLSDPYERDFPWRTGGRSFEDEYNQLKTFLENRLQWMDRQFDNRDPDIENRGWREDDALRLSLQVKDGELHDPGEMAAADHVATALSDLSVTLTALERGDYTFYLNGMYLETVTVGRDIRPIDLEITKDKLCKGVNVITVLKNVNGTHAESMAFISVRMPGDKYQNVDKGRLEPNTDPSVIPPEDSNPKPQLPTVTPDREAADEKGSVLPLPLMIGIAFDLITGSALIVFLIGLLAGALPAALVLILVIVILARMRSRKKKKPKKKKHNYHIKQTEAIYDQSNSME